ncbi:4-hydroxythreonine-4-phosphate dehydrogenase PdxA [Heyndrickxia coagulans]|uniref:4-hydroxythreonine-4-phosphate dehydrogenase n=1 Tax=Heyndrickxia coagulans 36D1 TaxID=345219 RepID=G2TI06_HEYCO|nr:4-hydroxythreonine-4-phosphate dehydrogenase PdxA [Heyndrickxia coagulans]AEP00939.1 4-hydroxythreonine-4-phosphate dehydrogenase [Heyndrickxia coagulans 36D1]APB37350.1 4-hydroxythreonine-4-phosphate dehydrogenase PdxA [Heyndrickxia coagulans]KYC91524.1 4-hydroxythreonine-4-phosphate dehydrogenase [Heyndrickxia coagulans]QPG53151.1 4-hydroxythreonine-4-phosphate dehydrogenase PdxA [Heyndrickxia coagulans]WNE61177.1 4-hydroxythreonine-4-phosphate dehydrogenase PdxA [Heyndrickxia coagulans]
MAANKPVIAITMGDPSGVGPEIIAKSLSDEEIYERCQPFVVGDLKILKRALAVTGCNLHLNSISSPEEGKYQSGTIDIIDLDLVSENLPWGQVSPEAGNAAFHYLEKAITYANEGRIQGICTAPLNKEAIHKAGHIYPGHTEILAELTNTKDFAMMLTAPGLRVIHVTTHIGLIDAIQSITVDREYTVIRLAHETLKKAGIESPKIAVCGINPHAGENGLFGHGEEEEKIIPAVEKARSEGINVEGPLPADTLFFRARRGDFDIVVAQYHDQGHGPIKVLGLEAGVNITVGLPIIRTSVDHGTAFDIAGKNIADELSLKEAIRMAIELAPKTLE